MVTIYDIAKACGLSPSTVSKVINDYKSIPEKTRLKVQQAMEEMNYIPNGNAKFLSKGQSYNVGVLAYFGQGVSPFNHPLFSSILDSFQAEMNKNGYDLIFISKNVAGKSTSFYKNCVFHNVDGVILFGDLGHKEMVEVIDSNIPTVGFDYFGTSMGSVVSNNYQAMFQLSEHIIFHGHKSIVFIHGDQNDVTQIRINAFKDALNKHNIIFDNSMLYSSAFLDYDNIAQIVAKIMARANPPTAIMFPDDYSAIVGIRELKNLGYAVPSDVSVTGFDGIGVTSLINPSVTTFKQNSREIGKRLAYKLLKEIKEESKDTIRYEVLGELIIAESTGDVIGKEKR